MQLRELLKNTLEKSLSDASSNLGAEITRDSLGLLVQAQKTGALAPEDLDLPNSMLYARILTAAGLLEERGDSMTPMQYVITEKGRTYPLQ